MSNFLIRQRGEAPVVVENVWELNLGAVSWVLGVVVGGLGGVLAGRRLRDGAALGKVERRLEGWPVNLAHRGGAGLAPEDTLVAFRTGLDAGAGGLELDVHTTADGHVVVIHDKTVDRTTDGSGPVGEMTLREVRRLDAGYRFSLDGETYPYRDRGVNVPTLEEVFRRFPDVPINIEIKGSRPGIERSLWQMIERAKAEDRTLVVAGDSDATRRFREASKGRVPTGASIPEMLTFYLLGRLRLTRLLRPAYEAIQVSETYRGVRIITPGFIRAAHDLGVRVDAWTVNAEDDMRRLLAIGVDGIMTDHPDVLARLLEGDGRDGTRAGETADLASPTGF